MSLVNRIQQALTAGVDPTVWEQAAIALLQEKYRWLSPIESGADIGRDGDIYNVHEGDSDSRGRLLATTSNVLSNLKSSHKTWKQVQSKTTFRIDALVIATPNPMSARARSNVEQYCRENFLPLPQFYTRDWLVPALIKAPAWREKLTGVAGRIDAIRPILLGDNETELVGRAGLVRDIETKLNEGRDLLLVGVPGVGKSRLLAEIGREAYLVEPLAKEYLVEDLLAFAPRVVAIDDAHFHPELLSELLRIRVQEALAFSIVATTWPYYAGEAALQLVGCRSLNVDLLPRDAMDQVVQDRGVKGIWARRLVLDQAEGRVGWAVTLCESLISQDGQRVLTGELLLERAMRIIRKVSDSESDVDAFAMMAALQGVSLEDLETIAELQRRPTADVTAAVRDAATSGLVEMRQDQYRLQPALRAPLIAQWFFSPTPRRVWDRLHTAFPERSNDLLDSMLETAVATRSPSARDAAWRWAKLLPPPTDWTEPTIGLVRNFSKLSRESSDWAASAARVILNNPRPPQTTLWGTTSDPLAIAAEGTLRTCIQSHFNKEAVEGLLDLSLIEVRGQHGADKDPLRVLQEMTQLLDPDQGTIFEIRARLLNFGNGWIGQKRGDANAWTTYCEIVRFLMTPSVRGSWTDPGQFQTFTMADAVETADRLSELSEYWPTIMSRLTSRTTDLSAPALNQLIGVVEDWLRVAEGYAVGSASVSSAQREAAARGAWAFVKHLCPLITTYPGAVLKLRDIVDRADRAGAKQPLNLSLPHSDPELETFVARRFGAQSTEAWMDGQTKLAVRIISLGPDRGVRRFMELQAVSEDYEFRADGNFLALEIAKAVQEPQPWVSAAIKLGSHHLTYRLLWELRSVGLSADLHDLEIGLSSSTVRGAITGAVLDGAVLDEGAQFVIERLAATDADSLDRLFARETVDDVLLALLKHPVLDVRAGAALAFKIGEGEFGPPLPDVENETWKSVLLESPLRVIKGHNSYRLREILDIIVKDDPVLCAEWFRNRVRDEAESADWRVDRLTDFEHVMRVLPRAQRHDLVVAFRANPKSRWRYLPELIGVDPDLADQLIADGTLTAEDAISGLSGERDLGAELLSPVLVRHGVDASWIARKVNGGRSWMGKESDAVKSDIDWFEGVARRVPTLTVVCRLALEELSRELARVLEEERIESVRGWA